MKQRWTAFARIPAALSLLAVAVVLSPVSSFSSDRGRPPSVRDNDPCGLPDTMSFAYRTASALNWGYGYDSLRADIARWSSNPFVHVDSVGASVQNRTLYMLTIQDTTIVDSARHRVWIHARTHPNEVQGTWVTNQIIAQLLGPTPFARQLRAACVFCIIPMINPDGVELKRARENANNIDIESNWTSVPGEPEVQTLRRMFTELMQQVNPISIALNMHSAYGTSRYFVYHATAGTSAAYAVKERRFINSVRSLFPGGIEPYDYFVSWTTAPSLVYPESWFWQNCHESVLALTYEDMNDASARSFDSTANAILHGIASEFGITGSTSVPGERVIPAEFVLGQNYPNPWNPSTTIEFSVQGMGFREVRLAVYDLLGREVAVLVNGAVAAGSHEVRFDGSGLSSGTYIYRLMVGEGVETRKMVLVR
jgi:hypothetical protein